ncbi:MULTISPECIES: cation transporter [unclassified Novosphingobium]|uniref:cation transporter n=1 Tax=unclassified Novosphingobium TaxID=2644732 RepID=UPI0025F75CCC|nr:MULTISPECIES: cation transporter [unclassified Novosphingobium]HQV04519.1 cation transporter [Novosphingobium sp.]
MADSCCAAPSNDNSAGSDSAWRRVLWIALIANGAMFLVEIIAGAASGSRALQADALDFLGDTANYAISLGVAGLALVWRARTALVKGLTILAFAFGVMVSAVWGIFAGTQPDPWAMTGIGALALVTNVSVAVLLYRFRAGDSNMRSVWVCSRNDAINNLLVIGAGAAVLWSGSNLPDLIVAFIMAAFGISGGWQVVRQALQELEQPGSPSLEQAE